MIRVEGLVKAYGSLVAVDGISFEVPERCVCGFLGPNGAGKSTTMRILAGFLAADRGVVEVAGRRVTPDDAGSRAGVGYLPENTPVDRRMRVGEYLDFVGRLRRMGAGQRRDAIARTVETCGLGERVGQRIGTLSKGFRQRVGLAQALLADPPVLVLDEPTSGLDPAEIQRIRALVRKLGEHKTVLLSTHVLSEVQDTASRVVMLRAGKVVADGSPMELAEAETPEVRATFVEPPLDVAQKLRGLRGVVAAAKRADDGHLAEFALAVEDREVVADGILALAAANGWRLYSLEQHRAGLEDVFLRRMERADEEERR